VIGKLITKSDRSDIIGKIMSYDPTFDEYTISFIKKSPTVFGERWEADWSAYLLFNNLENDWMVYDPSPVMDALLDWDV